MSRWPRSEIFDCDSLFAASDAASALLDRGELFAQRRDLLVEHVDLGERAGGDLLLLIERARRGGGPPGGVGGGRALRRLVLQTLLLALGVVEGRGEGRDLGLVDALLRALQREKIGQFLDLPVEPGERLVLAGHFAGEEELRKHEYRQQKDDDQQHRRQRVDEARPVVHRLVAASAR